MATIRKDKRVFHGNKCPKCGDHGHWARDCPKFREPERREPGQRSQNASQHYQRPATTPPRGPHPGTRDSSVVRCYNCNERGHFASSCPKRSRYCGPPDGRGGHEDRARRQGTMNGVYCTNILVDTRATQTLIHKDLVAKDDILDGEITIRCAHGDTASYPLAVVKIGVGGKDFITTAGVSSTLPASALLGWDIPELLELIADRRSAQTADALAVMTRLRRRKQQETLDQHTTTLEDVETVPELPQVQKETGLEHLSELDDSLFSPAGPSRIVLTRSQKRANCRNYRQADTADSREPSKLDVSPKELLRLQEEDKSLESARQVADGVPTAGAGENFRQDGLLYRKYRPQGPDGELRSVDQLVLPYKLRPNVLQLAHDIPMAGHLGRNKTMDRITRIFYWPGMYGDVRNHCQTCAECQKSVSRRVKKAPLVPLPIMDVPFQRVAMDIVGPLPRSSSGKRYILVICDYATRYPEAVALRSIDANTIAEELMAFFACVGVPDEILTNQGTNFTSQLLTEVYRLLQIKPIRTTPYHPQTDGLVERFNGTFKTILKKVVSEEGRDWDRLLPYLLFAYREVPQASTEFSPFELVYGHNVRGPLDILKESWEVDKKSSDSVVSYVMMVQERLAQLREIVDET